MADEKTISIIVPARNEVSNLLDAVSAVDRTAGRWFVDHEILIFNDASTDQTGEVADRLAEELPKVQVFHNKIPRSLGGVYKDGLAKAKMNYVTRINGCDDMTESGLDKIFSLAGKTDLIVPYTENMRDRPLSRRVLSQAFTQLLNILTGRRLHYYNHSVLLSTQLARSVPIKTNSYAFQAEALIWLLRRGCSVIEVGVVDRFHSKKRTKAFQWHNVKGVLGFLMRMGSSAFMSK